MNGVLDSIDQLWRKAEREAYRSYNAHSKTHKADHFFNFCVTAHSLRDYFVEQKSIHERAGRTQFNDGWNADPLLRAVADIANLAKHFQLRDRKTGQPRSPRVRRVLEECHRCFDLLGARRPALFLGGRCCCESCYRLINEQHRTQPGRHDPQRVTVEHATTMHEDRRIALTEPVNGWGVLAFMVAAIVLIIAAALMTSASIP